MAETMAKFGAGFRTQHYQYVTENKPSNVDVFEIVSENFMGVGGRPFSFLEKLRADYPILMHGVGLSIGSVGPLNREYLVRLKQLIDRVQPWMVSDHLCWTTFQNHNSHDLLPVAYTNESLENIASKLGQIQDFLGRRFYLENPSAYVAFAEAEWSEADFFAELVRRSGAGVMLDVNNLYVNYHNLGLDPMSYLEKLPVDAVGYMHLAGHSYQDNIIVDTHDHPVCDDVWDLYKLATQRFSQAPVVVEWDGNVPEFDVLAAETQKARDRHANQVVEVVRSSSNMEILSRASVDSLTLYRQFFSEITRLDGITQDGDRYLAKNLPAKSADGLSVYNHAYFLRLLELVEEDHEVLKKVCSDEGLKYLVAAYLEACPPMHYSVSELTRRLASFLRAPETSVNFDFGVPLAVLGDIAAVERAQCDVFIAPNSDQRLEPSQLAQIPADQWPEARFNLVQARVVDCAYQILPVFAACRAEELPSVPVAGPNQILVYRQDMRVREEAISEWIAALFIGLSQGANFEAVCARIQTIRGDEISPEEVFADAAKTLFRWTQLGLVERI